MPAILAACVLAPAQPASASDGILSSAPQGASPGYRAPAKGAIVGLPHGALAYIPAGAAGERPASLLLVLHGTGGNGSSMISTFRRLADRHGFVILAPNAQGPNWDGVDLFFDAYEAGRRQARILWPEPVFGRDVRMIDDAMAALFRRVPIDRGRIGIAGYSHGASYALMLGTANPRLFGSILAFSPGILVTRSDAGGGQGVYIAHGTNDIVQPFRRARGFVPRLIALGNRVVFRPFDGGHMIHPAALAEAIRFFLAAPPPGRPTVDKGESGEVRAMSRQPG